MKPLRPLALLFAAVLLVPSLAFANTAPGTTREEVRKELAAFFAQMGAQSPLGDISKSPATLQEIDKRIDSMSDADVAQFQKMMTEVPDWKNAPQTITKMLPAGALKKIQATSAAITARAPQAEKTRNDIRTLAAVLKLLPDSKLKELGIQRPMIDSLESAVGQLTPVQSGVLEQKLGANAAWQANATTALNGMPPALQKGAAALAKHGPLTKDDIVALDKFRDDLSALLRRVDALPDSARAQIHIESIGANIAQLERATPEVLFMLRSQMPPDAMQKLSESVGLMERIANLTPDDQKMLESFRGDLEGIFAKGDHAAENREKIDSLTPGELLVLKDGVGDVDAWKETSNAYFTAISDPGLSQRIAAVSGASPDPAAVASLEQFRTQALARIDSMGASADPAAVQEAHAAVAQAPLAKLELLRSVTNSGQALSAKSYLRAATDISLNCVVSLGSIDLGALGSFSLGSIDFNWICGPIQDAINNVGNLINSAVSAASTALTNVINTVQATLQSAITAVTNTVDTLVNGIISTVNTIWNFIQTIPDLVWNGIKTALNAFLDIDLGGGLTIRTLISGGISQVVPKLQQALNLGENFWNSLNDSLPLLPCPPDGFSTPFGTVGTDDAVTKYNRYHFFLDKIVGMIPSDAISLEVKIPAEVLYSAWDYLGVCLQDAANARDSATQDARFNTLSTGITNITNQGASNTQMLSQQIAASFAALTNVTNTNDSNLSTLVTDKAIDIENLIKQKSDDAQQLDLRLQIELNLAAGQGNALAMFELPKANGGYLETARDIVNNEISSMLAAGQPIGQAQKFFNDALSSISSGQFKTAYDSLQKAYRELTKNN